MVCWGIVWYSIVLYGMVTEVNDYMKKKLIKNLAIEEFTRTFFFTRVSISLCIPHYFRCKSFRQTR